MATNVGCHYLFNIDLYPRNNVFLEFLNNSKKNMLTIMLVCNIINIIEFKDSFDEESSS